MKIRSEQGQILSLRPGEYFKMTGIKFRIGIFPLEMLKPLKNSRILSFSYEKLIKNHIQHCILFEALFKRPFVENRAP